MRQLSRFPLLAAFAASGLVFVVVYGLRTLGALEPLELAAYDWHLRLRPAPQRPAPPVVLITVTEKDIQQLGTWPVPDAVLAEALETISRANPRAIGLDIYRDVPVPPGHERLSAVFRERPRIVAAMLVPHADKPGVAPPPALRDTDRVGFTDMIVDPDGTVRRGLLMVDDGERVFYSLPLRVALLYFAQEGIRVQGDPDNPAHLRIGRTTLRPFEPSDGSYVRADAGGYQFLLDYRDRIDAFPVVTLGQLLAGRFDPALLENKIVLIGVAAESVKDSFYTPYRRSLADGNRVLYGVALYGHMVSQLLRAAAAGDAPVAVVSEMREALWILLWSLLGGAAALGLRSTWRFALAIAGGLALLFAAVHGLFVLGWWIPVVPPALGWVGAAGVVTAYVLSREKKERAELMSLFSSYVSAQLAEAIWKDRDQFLSGGRPRPQRLTATVFFSDVASFTTVSERLDPQILMDWFYEFMEAVTPVVSDHGGVIFRFIGDSIMAVFGVPVPRASEKEIAQDASNAVKCALAIQARVIALNSSLAQRGLPPIGMRIGILTGPMVAGSLGSAKRLEYNVHGDTVNTASRLEGFDKDSFNPDYFNAPCRILVGESTFTLLGDEFHGELVGEVRLKGKTSAIRIYRIQGRKGERETAPVGKEVLPALRA